eukprot:scaffold10501_cov141-Amphora_coffeaeformis.AAC.11
MPSRFEKYNTTKNDPMRRKLMGSCQRVRHLRDPYITYTCTIWYTMGTTRKISADATKMH